MTKIPQFKLHIALFTLTLWGVRSGRYYFQVIVLPHYRATYSGVCAPCGNCVATLPCHLQRCVCSLWQLCCHITVPPTAVCVHPVTIVLPHYRATYSGVCAPMWQLCWHITVSLTAVCVHPVAIVSPHYRATYSGVRAPRGNCVATLACHLQRCACAPWQLEDN